VKRHLSFIIAALALSSIAGCGSSPKERFYTLSTGAAPELRSDAGATYTVAIGPVAVPDIVDRPQFVLRTGANEVMVAEQARWAEPLKNEIPRVVADNLAQLLTGARVFAYADNGGLGADYRVTIDVQRFDSKLGDSILVDALWTIRTAKGAPKIGRTLAREAAGGAGYDALVIAHGRALAAVSRDIAEAVRALSAAAR
jgi:uncharacterized lipoprotein YmbA